MAAFDHNGVPGSALDRNLRGLNCTRCDRLSSDLAAAQEALQFVERWVNHHGVKPCVKPEHALSTIQHYPPILAITESYEDGRRPETRNPWVELAARDAELAVMKQRAEAAERKAEEAARDAAMLAFIFGCFEINADSFKWRGTGNAEKLRQELIDISGVDAAIAAKGEA